MSQALTDLLSAITYTNHIIAIHTSFTTGARGRPPIPTIGSPAVQVDLEVLPRSAVVLCAAIWEDYIRCATRQAVAAVVGAAATVDYLPNGLRWSVARLTREQIQSDGDLLKIYSLSGDGYKTKCYEWVETRLTEFDEPSADAVEALLKDCINLRLNLDDLRWANMRVSARDKLDDLLCRQHEIIHRGTVGTRGGRTQAIEDERFVRNLARQVDQRVSGHLRTQFNVLTW